ncbi:MAG: Glutamyl-tRNA(Gln) amidotransferase subunit A [Syntrophaceae bacterium PtaU1.Bin231]|nr:MAG: Glutamyl-tRNA(Gln) amidotransferase subunit A [Syntrophaceae bacterium PtaU1.Bin231]
MAEPRDLSIRDALRLLRKGELRAEELVLSCLKRIRSREQSVHAWVEVAEEKALIEARGCDDAFRAGTWKGELHGIPIGVKDIIDVRGLWTRAGCSVYPARIAEADAAAVRRLRDAGAVILGKTETTAFATNDPTITRNPWNTEHTPGGSSSGSGAAVADRMTLAALGTQTAGSVLRPAAYNGIVGFKATYASVSLEGVVPASWTLDHLGVLCRSVEDAALLYAILREARPQPFARMPADPGGQEAGTPQPPFRLGYFRSFIEREADDSVRRHFESLLGQLRQAGALVVDVEFLDSLTRAAKAHSLIMDTELAAYHRDLFAARREAYPPNIAGRVVRGLATPAHAYVEAVCQRMAFQGALSAVLADLDAVLLPTAPSAAPQGLSSTGSPVFCVPWSMSGFPSITIPSGLDHQRLPLALEIGTGPFQEKKLLALASWCESQLFFSSRPA